MVLNLNLLLIFWVVLFVKMKIITAAPTPTTSSPISRFPYSPNIESSKLPSKRTGSKSYYLGVHFKLNWFEAHLYCRRYGMQLVTPSTKVENDEIIKYLIDQGVPRGGFWTAGVDLNEEGRYYWMSNGELIRHTNWHHPLEPNNDGGREHCIQLIDITGNTYKWNDMPCGHKLNFICEI